MNRGFPSMTALLGLLAVAGYQNRDKIAEMLGGIGKSTSADGGQSGSAPADSRQGGIGGLLGQLSSSLGGASAGGILSGGLSELVDRFRQNGHAETATPGSARVQTSQSHHLSFSKRLALTYWILCQSRPDYRRKNYSRGCRANCLMPSINIRRKDECRPKNSACGSGKPVGLKFHSD